MKQSQMLIPTLRDVPADAEIKSHQLLIRAGYIRKNASGIYSFLPLGRKVLQKVEAIVREEMNKIGANEMLMPVLQDAELWRESGRWDKFGPQLMRLNDRHDREFALGATHEEVITSIIRDDVNSYKRLPLALYQIQTKYRDEKRPRFGLLRGREFTMKDAYSFHATKESLDEMYEKMYTAYSNVFERCGLNFRPVIADSGAMGGKDTHEFMALSDVGEDTIAYSDISSFAANIEMAPVLDTYEKSTEEAEEMKKIATPDAKTISDVAKHLGIAEENCMKSLLFKVDERFVLVIVRGDHELNEIKFKHLLEAEAVTMATEEDAQQLLGASFGSLGPIDVTGDVEIIADNAVKAIVNGTCGANENGYHYMNVNVDRDFKPSQFADLRFIKEGDLSPDGEGTIQFAKGIEVGQVFKLGTYYSEKMGAQFLDENGKAKPMIMGCYGIGVSRTLAAIVEQFNDESGIVWPKAISPFSVHLIPINVKNDIQRELADKLYNELSKVGFDVLYDDRKERPGVKFADSDLIGIPYRVTVGKKAEEGIVELKYRETGETEEVSVSELANRLVN
ncbi:proline--tRNA ligase [Bacillus solimangrovi]|uniref:Proline--tRNA ligase n=1 Tax=Bacillus solimangrovi TaxID=1305675 RepID=A0A1E5LE39_9BACI|nr:proline--tRNA ligase [Bacillus solimangrovi]OEH92322.1 proline--tRNA ligase [Bacillus solimangrovi]